jgi:predicted alpha/beta-hydrolase family hydrolase
LVLTHGAGANCKSQLLVRVAEAFTNAGWYVLRCDLPFRRRKPFGPPMPSGAAEDRQGLKAAATELKAIAGGEVFIGGHSYGGRQASMLAAEEPQLAAGLLLLSYPLHPPNKPANLRTAHFAGLQTPATFIHGTKDPFGTVEELRRAIALIPAPTKLVTIENAGHDLRKGAFDISGLIVS